MFTATIAYAPPTGASIVVRLEQWSGHGKHYLRAAQSAALQVDGSGRAEWSPDYASIGALADGTWQVEARMIINSADGSQQTTSGWSAPTTFQTNSTVPATPTITANPDDTFTLSSPGAAGFQWSVTGTFDVFGSGEDICTSTPTEGVSGRIMAGPDGTVTLPASVVGPMPLYVKAFTPSGQLSDMATYSPWGAPPA